MTQPLFISQRHRIAARSRLLPIVFLLGLCLALLLGPRFFRAALAVETSQDRSGDASFHLTNHTPRANAVGVAVDQNITATFDAALAASTVTSRTFSVRSSLRGLFTDSATVSGSGLTVNPGRDFFAGEQVQVVGTGAISSTEGAALSPVQWGFSAGPVTSRCVAPFVESGAFDDALPGVLESGVAWADYDGDGRLDILLTGQSNGGPVSRVYRNTPAGFVDSGVTIPGIYRSSVAWGDYDNDGQPDLLLTGLRAGGPGAAVLRNNGGAFVGIGAADNALLPVYRGSVAWGDYDNDGDLDILLTGLGNSSYVAAVYRNDNGFFVDSGAADDALVGVVNGSVAWGDYDNDGDLDILLTGDVQGGGPLAKLYRNDNGLFVESGAADDALAGVARSSAAWGDYDNDGDLDILLTGQGNSGKLAKVYRNDGGTFMDSGAADDALVGVAKSSVAWADYDNDGKLDILLTGESDGGPVAKLYRNSGGGFVESGNIDDALAGVYDGSAAWGDYNNDGKLDILLTGQSSNGPVTKIYRNEDCAGSTPTPTATTTATATATTPPATPTPTPTATATLSPPSDGNGDGIPDVIQPNVQSVLSSAGHYVTLAGPGGATLTNAQALTATLPPPTGVELAQGLIGFVVDDLLAGSAFSVTLTIHSGPEATSFWKFGPTADNTSDHWYEFAYDGETGAQVNGRQTVLHFVDGKRGDSDLLANGSITDPGGPAGVVVDEFIYLPAITR